MTAGEGTEGAEAVEPHVVLVEFGHVFGSFEELKALGDALRDAFETTDVGEYDGFEVTEDLAEGALFFFGADGDLLFAYIAALLRGDPRFEGAAALIRYGGEGAPEETHRLGASAMN